jgi:hypothetical protein
LAGALGAKTVAAVMLLGWILMASMAWSEIPSIAVKPHQVFAFNDLGMHCYDSDYSVFTILPPFNTLHAQIVKRGARPVLMDNSRVRVFYRAMKDPSGSINKTSGSMEVCPRPTSGTTFPIFD